MPKKTKTCIAVIADLIDSKQIKDRYAFQKDLAADLAKVGAGSLESPYTLTLGDEFQALYGNARGLLYDILQIRAFIYPVRCRFSIAIGEITTPINPNQAIGMDGPAFHLARKKIEQLKNSDNHLSIAGLPAALNQLLSPALDLLWTSTESWNANRLQILLRELESMSARQGEYQLEITERAINKNIREARLRDWVKFIESLEAQISQLIPS
ncbi:SatD family protein [Coraliomargarita sp. SDUM461004]|uniref:SatD family protein n=1 Tax=Thalassobacterium sedimentorum TaxID=3041258 RepID=A0ABU1ANE0_9BACT|nr:SatD family protein [Coraliomargarita sp. SDUM461004]MDQ8196301.1 SatD family protein [Coraliomargarita sp. SDUM461004]